MESIVDSRSRYILYAASILLITSITGFCINWIQFHYPGNDYFPPNTPYIALCLILIHLGLRLYFSKFSMVVIQSQELIYFFLVMCLIALATNAAQYTPFSVIDPYIISLEQTYHIDMKAILLMTHNKPYLSLILQKIYDTLPYQMIYIPLALIVTKRFDYIREYYFLILVTAIIGFTCYYFFPTMAPASLIVSPYFSESQLATGLKFMQIHHHIPPTTLEGGLIALPSFHVIWAWLCQYSLKSWPIVFYLMLPINCLLILSCVLLGWHYLIDILGGVTTILIAHGLYRFCARSTVSMPDGLLVH